MDSVDIREESDESSDQEAVRVPTKYARAYQLEMFELSMQGNIIVAGLAKRICETSAPTALCGRHIKGWIYKLTQLCSAKLRIEAELERTSLKKIWFLAPTVNLAHQQHRELSGQLSYHNFRLITGLDNVQFWSTQEVWDSVLNGVNVVISTPQVLLEALSHAFVSIQDLSLIVFDEAHHCVAKHPMANIMRLFYHPLKSQMHSHKLPHILGLTASSITSKVSDFEKLETNLNAVCKSPTMQIEDLRKHVHVPKLEKITYDMASPSAVLESLREVVSGLEIKNEPNVKRLAEANNIESKAKLDKIGRRGYTKIMKQLRSFLSNAEDIEMSLGIWAAKLYVNTCIAKLHAVAEARESIIVDLADEDLRYVKEVLQPVTRWDELNEQSALSDAVITQKVRVLIDYLIQHYRPGLTAIVFVKRRSTAFILTQLLTAHPLTAHFGIFAFVGITSHSSRGLGDLADAQLQNEAFDDFRIGRRNVCIATSVMEEGIDVQATNLVIRFDAPDNFRAFIQSRGRARQPDSRIAVMLSAEEDSAKLEQWAILEAEMKAMHSSIDRIIATESANEHDDEGELCDEYYQVSNTGAVLTYDNARSHLEHFCNTQSLLPIFMISGTRGESMSAQIRLPSSVATSLQVTNSLRTWRSEKAAIKDASFQCYRNLHIAGVVNNHLLPFQRSVIDDEKAHTRDSKYQIKAALNPWFQVHGSKLYAHRVEVFNQDRAFPPLLLMLPHRIDHVIQFPLQSTPYGTLEAKISIGTEEFTADSMLLSRITSTLFSLILGRRLKGMNMNEMSKLPYLVTPDIPAADMQTWIDKTITSPCPMNSLVFNDGLQNQRYLLRYRREEILYLWSPSFEGNHARRYSEEETILAERLTRQLHFLDPAPSQHQADYRRLIVEHCSVEALPAAYGELMVLMPSILHMVELNMRGQLLIEQSPLQEVRFSNSKMVSMALVASSASSAFNYDRLEFLGDALLKFYVSVQLYFKFPLLAEGSLTGKRGALIGNVRLQEVTRNLGLDKYLTTEAFSGQAWTLDINSTEQEERHVSSKTLADIVESLLGASYLDDGHLYGQRDLIVSTLNVVLPEMRWQSPTDHIEASRTAKMGSMVNTAAASLVEGMLHYQFNNKHLLAEALTKSSLREGASSYERLEFLGDAVLDYIVGTAIYGSRARDSNEMTLWHHSLVNHHLLALLGLELSRVTYTKKVTLTSEGASISDVPKVVRLIDHLTVVGDKTQTEQRERAESTYLAVSKDIQHAFTIGKSIPWALIRSIDTTKSYSDVVESIIGAVFVDSGGSISACEKVLDVFGFTNTMNRVLNDADLDSRFSIEKLRHSYTSVYVKHRTSGQISKGTKKWTCVISLYGKEISSFASFISVAHAEQVAADLALEVLASRKEEDDVQMLDEV